MPLAQNGRGIRGLVWTDPDGQPHTILLAYLGDKVVWDGHIHETIQVPAMVGASTLPVPVVGSASLVEVPLLSALADLPAPALVGGGVTVSPDEMSVDAVAFVPVLHSDHTLDIDVAAAAGDLLVPDIRVVFGVTPESMTAAAVLHAPAVFASVLVSPPEMVAFVEVRNPDVGSWAIIDVPVMSASAAAGVPVVVASSRVDAEVASSTAAALVPTVTAGSRVDAVLATTSADAAIPTVSGGGFSRQKMSRSGPAWQPTGSLTRVPDMASDPSAPATVTSSALVVAGGGPATITGSVTWSGIGGAWTSTEVWRNGTRILTVLSSSSHSAGTFTASTSSPITLVAGDVIELRSSKTTSTFEITTAYVEVVPT